MQSRLIGKDPDAGKDWKQEKGMTEDKMVGWHHRFNGHEFEQVLGDGEGQGSLACCSPRGCRDRHDWITEKQQQRETMIWWIFFSALVFEKQITINKIPEVQKISYSPDVNSLVFISLLSMQNLCKQTQRSWVLSWVTDLIAELKLAVTHSQLHLSITLLILPFCSETPSICRLSCLYL